MFKNPDNKVVVIYYQPMPKRVQVSGTDIYFDCQHGLSLAFVDESIVEQLLTFRGGCCGGQASGDILGNRSPVQALARWARWKIRILLEFL